MIKRLISFLLTLVFLVAIPLSAAYRYNPYTRKLDYYEPASAADLGDLADITLTGLATGNVLYYNGAAWVNLATGANGEVLTLAAGIPSWVAAGAPAAHAASHEVGGADLVDHDQLTGYLAAQHLTLPNTIVAVLTDHDLAAHTALGLFDASADVDHNLTTNYLAAQHLTLPATIATVLTDHDLAAHTALGLFDAPGDVDHNLTLNYVANQHINWTAAASNFSTSEDFTLTWADAADRATITQAAVAGIEDQPLVLIDDSREGATVDEISEATLRIQSEGYGLVVIGKSYLEEDVEFTEDLIATWASTGDRMTITQASAVGTEGQPLINISDARTGATANSVGEATIVIDAEGTYALYIADGFSSFGTKAFFTGQAEFSSTTVVTSDNWFIVGAGNASAMFHDTNAANDGILRWDLRSVGADSAVVFMTSTDQAVNAMSDHDGYINPTLVLASVEGADPFDYAGVVIGERAQADVKVAHYFDFYAMTGSMDGAVDPANAELAAIFRFGASGSTVPIYATTPGDVLIEGALEIAGVFGEDTTAHNLVLGTLAGEDLAAGSTNNILVGENAGKDITTGDSNVIIGYNAGDLQTVASYNILIGEGAGTSLGATANTSYNVMIGHNAGRDSAQFSEMNVFIGYNAGLLNTGGYDNVFIGMYAGDANLTGFANTCVGNDAGSLITGSYNTLVGGYAGWQATGGNHTFIGGAAGYSITTGGDNVGVGRSALYDEDDGGWNVAVGSGALIDQDSAWFNVGVGYQAGYFNVTGQHNTSVGQHAGYGVVGNSNSNNVFVGSEAAEFVTTSSSNVIIGMQAAEDLTSGGGHVVIGYMAGEGWLTTETNLLVIANSDTATPLLYGEFTTGDLASASLLHNSDHRVTGYNRYETIYWIECFDYGIAANRYSQNWDITSLNTQGNGTNTIDTTPSHITLTTDNNGVGDNEGTISHFQIVTRAEQNRTEWNAELAQTVNTSFFCGWNTSQTNAMVAAADEYVIVFFDVSDNANWQIKVGDGATEDVFTSAVAADTNHIRHEIWVETDGTVHWAVNGTELDITGTVNNLMDAADHYLIFGQAQSVTGAAVIVAEIHYVENEKTK